MTPLQAPWAHDYLSAFEAANGKTATLQQQDGGYIVVAEDGASTGLVYSQEDVVRLTQRLRERALTAAH